MDCDWHAYLAILELLKVVSSFIGLTVSMQDRTRVLTDGVS